MIASSAIHGHPTVAAIAGAGGRLGKHIVASLEKIGIVAAAVPREALQTVEKTGQYLQAKNASVLINSAVTSRGSFEEMKSVNVDCAVRLGKAAKSVGIPFVQISSTAASIAGIDPEKTPYSWSKKLAEQELKKVCDPIVIKIDALVGTHQHHQIDIGSLALGKAPAAVRIRGDRHLIQPTSYLAAGKVVANIAHEKIGGHLVPGELTVAGDPIELFEFIHLVKKGQSLFRSVGLEFLLDPERLLSLAEVVQNGCLSPEFLHLGVLASRSPLVHDNEEFIHYHGEPIPTHEELAEEMRKNTFCRLLKTGIRVFRDSPEKLRLISEAWRVWQTCDVKARRIFS